MFKAHYLTVLLAFVFAAGITRAEEKKGAEAGSTDSAFAQPRAGTKAAAAPTAESGVDPEEKYRVAFEAFLKAKQQLANAEQDLAEAKARLEAFRQNAGIRQQIQQALDDSGKKSMSDDEKRRLQEKISRLIEQLK